MQPQHRPVVALLALLVAAAAGCDAGSPKHPAVTGHTEQFPLTGTRVADTFSIFVRLPEGYDAAPDRHFPLVLQLDANLALADEFLVTAGFASELEAAAIIPPTIVVGIGYPYADTPQKGRNRDYTLPLLHPDISRGFDAGGAPQFLEFLRDELMPTIEARYRVQGPRGRALFGHSLGGLFTDYALLQYDPAKPFVTGFVPASPSLWYDSGSVYRYLDGLHARTSDLPLIVYTTVGTLEGPVMTVYFDDLSQRLADFPTLKLKAEKNSTDHMGNVSPSFREGLKFLFENGLGEAP